jgi:hypothetical protein
MTLSRRQLVTVEDALYYPAVSLDNCSCVVLISYVPVTMKNRHTPGRRTVPSQSITTVDGGLKAAGVFYSHSLPSTFVVML